MYTLVKRGTSSKGDPNPMDKSHIYDNFSYVTIGRQEVNLAFENEQEAQKWANFFNSEDPTGHYSPRIVNEEIATEYRLNLAQGKEQTLDSSIENLLKNDRRKKILGYVASFTIGATGGYMLFEHTDIIEQLANYFF